MQSLDCHDFLRSLAVTEYFATPSLRGVKRRSNPGSERWVMNCHGFLNENLAMTGCSRLPRCARSDVVVVCGECGNDGGWTRFLGILRGLPLRRWGGGKDRSTTQCGCARTLEPGAVVRPLIMKKCVSC